MHLLPQPTARAIVLLVRLFLFLQTVEDIRRIVNDARTKAAVPPVRGAAVALAACPGCLLASEPAAQSAVRSCGPRHCTLSPLPVGATLRLTDSAPLPPGLQPAVRDFNEEDYMDGDLMDEELVE